MEVRIRILILNLKISSNRRTTTRQINKQSFAQSRTSGKTRVKDKVLYCRNNQMEDQHLLGIVSDQRRITSQ
jgi:hypothetical protein